jgi:hypothetical protein
LGVEGEGTEGHDLFQRAPRAAQLRPDPGLELFDLERLDQIIVRAAVEPAHPARKSVVGGEDQHGSPVSSCPQAPQHFDAVEFRQAEIEDDQCVVLRLQGRIGLVTAVNAVHRVFALAQQTAHPFGKVAIVFRQQDAHRIMVSSVPLCP